MKFIKIYEQFLLEKDGLDSSISTLMADVKEIDDAIKGEIIDANTNTYKISTDDIDLAQKIYDMINADKTGYSIKSAKIVDSNDIEIEFLTTEEKAKAKKETEDEVKKKQSERDILLGTAAPTQVEDQQGTNGTSSSAAY